MSKAAIAFGVGTMVVGASLGPFIGLWSAAIGIIIGLSLIVYGLYASGEDTANTKFFIDLRQARSIPAPITRQEWQAPELIELRTLVGELNEEIGNYGPNKDAASLREKLSKVERAAGTFGHDKALRQSIRDIHNTLMRMFVDKERGNISMTDKDIREELEQRYQSFLTELNRLL